MNKIYKMYSLTSDSSNLPKVIDYYIYSANCNIRCYNSHDILEESECDIKNKIVLDYGKLRPRDEGNPEAIQNYEEYTNHTQTNVVSCVNDDDDVNYIRNLQINSSDCICIDITGLTVPDMYRILYILREIMNVVSLHVFYTEPKHYVFKKYFFSTYEYLSGERTYKVIPEYQATGSFNSELLVYFLGFDMSVSDYVYEKALPQDTVAINGFPSYLPKLKDISLLNNYSLLMTNNIDSECRYFTSANNPFCAYNTLQDIREKFPEHLMNICSLGTKPMALGACLFSLDNPRNIKVTYPYPQNFAPRTAESSNKAWHYLINFN